MYLALDLDPLWAQASSLNLNICFLLSVILLNYGLVRMMFTLCYSVMHKHNKSPAGLSFIA